jgi:selenium metabolism protein YedF
MKLVMILNSEFMGRGDDELGQRLMGAMLRKVWSSPAKPQSILFYNSSVKLLARGSSVLDALEGLAAAGVDLVACGTCVGHFQLKDQLATGRVSDMQEIVSQMMAAEKVITI